MRRIVRMEEPKLARLTGESFSLITGLDLACLDLEVKPPAGVDFGPSDDPEDDDVAMDEDDSLPWPDPAKLAAWWQADGPPFAAGTRCFMGEPPTPGYGLRVLKDGFQRQRIDAALQLCLLRPGTPLFPTAAPAGASSAGSTRWPDRPTMRAKYVFAALAVAFLALAVARLWQDGFRVVPASRTWLVVGSIFAVVSAWLR